MKKTWTKVVVVALSCMMAFAMAACGGGSGGSSDAGDNVLKMGCTGPLTGPAAIYGNAVKNGGQIAVDEINAANPDGVQVAWQVEDDEADGEKAVNAYNKLMDDGMQVFVGSVTSGACVAVAEKTNADRVFELTPSASQAAVTEAAKGDIEMFKYAKAVSIEAVSKYGAENAVQRTDDEFLNELQNKVLTDFYTFLNTGTLTGQESTWQMALAMAKGKVLDKFNKLRRTVTNVVGFANVLDAYKYIGAAGITVQTAFGIQYIKDFMGYSTLFLLSAPDIAVGTVIALPVENIDLYYIDPADSDFAKLGLKYTVEGETNLIGFHAQGNYNTAVGESFALMGMKLWAEYLDGIAVVTVGE